LCRSSKPFMLHERDAQAMICRYLKMCCMQVTSFRQQQVDSFRCHLQETGSTW
jgi:hypothetical protein